MKPQVCLIFARAANGVIGKDNTIPWHLPEDMAHFKALTQGHPVVMGRRTWDSLPPRFRPLPGRTNIVVTRKADWSETGAQRASSLQEALSFCEQSNTSGEVWMIGGAQIYAQALPLADRVEVTEIGRDIEGDAYAPELGPEWREATRSAHVAARDGMPYAFVRYTRA